MSRIFSMNISGKVKNYRLTKSESLLPLFEAIANSIFAIDQRKDEEQNIKGSIDIEIIRDNNLFGEYSESFINCFNVKDNGVGFNDINMDSFMTSDSQLKEKFGGKGNGRFSWLKVFNLVEIESVYKEGDNRFKRLFTFSKSNDTIEDKVIDATGEKVETTIRLKYINESYKSYIPISINEIANKMIEHFVVVLLSDNCPTIKLFDEKNEIIINDKFKNDFFGESEKVDFLVDEYSFSLTSLRIKNKNFGQNKLYYCANDRLVKCKTIDNIVNLDESIYDKEGFWYLGILTGSFLDANVDYNRQSFSIEDDSENEISMNKISRETVSKIKSFLSSYLEKVNEEKMERIKKFSTKQAPEYKYLIEYKKEEVAKLKPSLSDDELDDSLFKIKRDFEREVRERCDDVIQKMDQESTTSKEIEIELKDALEKIAEMNKSELAKYITKRKIVLDIFRKILRLKNNGKYELEKTIHDLIFPMKKTGETCDYYNHNLWLIDEKLSYSVYIASDIAFENDPDEKRPDILICDGPVAVSDDDNQSFYDTIYLFEIKRPQRDDFDAENNPYNQLINYVEKIQLGKVKDKFGRPIRVNEHTQFFLYAVCDLTPSLYNALKRIGFKFYDHDKGAFYYASNYNSHVELLSFDKMLDDSELRNKVFFKKLGID